MKTKRKITMQKIMHYVHVCNGISKMSHAEQKPTSQHFERSVQ